MVDIGSSPTEWETIDVTRDQIAEVIKRHQEYNIPGTKRHPRGQALFAYKE
jgi:hypothetical protein